MLTIWTTKKPGVERKERHCSGYLLPLPGGELAKEEEGDAARVLVARTRTRWCQMSRGYEAAALWVLIVSDLKYTSRFCSVRT